MIKRIQSLFLVASLLVLSFPAAVLAQEESGSSADDITARTIRDASTVAFCGLGGAILGLSTLSFVDKPGDHLKNILVGGAVGLIVGVGIVAFFQAGRAKNDYGDDASLYTPDPKFAQQERSEWHWKNHNEKNPRLSRAPTSMGLSFQF